MRLYLGIHDFGGPQTDDGQIAGWTAYKASCDKHGCKAIRVHLSPKEGKAFCLTEASSADEVLTAHKESDVPSSPTIVEVQVVE